MYKNFFSPINSWLLICRVLAHDRGMGGGRYREQLQLLRGLQCKNTRKNRAGGFTKANCEVVCQIVANAGMRNVRRLSAGKTRGRATIVAGNKEGFAVKDNSVSGDGT